MSASVLELVTLMSAQLHTDYSPSAGRRFGETEMRLECVRAIPRRMAGAGVENSMPPADLGHGYIPEAGRRWNE